VVGNITNMDGDFLKLITERELEMLKMKLKGRLSNKEIAKKLNVSEAYVSKTLKNVSKKIKSIEDAIEVCKELGIIKEEKIEINTEALKIIRKKAINTLRTRKGSIPKPLRAPKIEISPDITKRKYPEKILIFIEQSPKIKPTLTYELLALSILYDPHKTKTISREVEIPLGYEILYKQAKPVFYTFKSL